MKPPEYFKEKLYRQWQQASHRVNRLLDTQVWPIAFSISKPSTRQIEQESDAVKQHIQAWQQVNVGKVVWQKISFRGLAEPISLPTGWELASPGQWVAAVDIAELSGEYQLLNQVLLEAPAIFHENLIRKRQLWRGKSVEEVIQCVRLAARLEPGAAQGKPLRAMAGFNVDTKFFERNEKLLVSLLDERFGGEVSKQGLGVFLDARPEDDHWLLVVPLQDGLLPFSRLRLSTKQLEQNELPVKTILVVENERCEHLLPCIDDTIAILGAGLDLSWLSSKTFYSKRVIYWGDIDTWGFQMLAAARLSKPELESVLMDQATFEQCKDNSSVIEPVKAENVSQSTLTQEEKTFYKALQNLEKGRLEQEYIPAELVEVALLKLINE
ncbi:MAG: DUF2220 family protein [Reinekea sp.]|jgi:hypothetical protein